MPIYEYRCTACGFEKEYLQKLSDAPIAICEECGKPSMTKLVSAAGFQLKGSGWYVTDFKNNGATKNKPAAQAGKESKPDAARGDSGATPSTEPKTGAETKTSDGKATASAASGSSSTSTT
jgi:putative FmdB family regulatory protein